MSTLRTDTLETLDGSVSVKVADLAQSRITVFDTVAAMIAADLSSIDYILLGGYLAKADSEQSYLYVDHDDTSTTADNGVTFVTSAGIRVKRLGITHVTPQMFGAVGKGVTDDTTRFNAAWTYCSTNSVPFKLNSKYALSKWSVTGAHVQTVLCQNAELIGNAAVATTALVELFNSSDVKFTGEIKLTGNYNTLYDSGLLVHGASVAQYIEINGMTITGFKWAQRWGNTAYPDALVSENSFNGGHTYGCPGGIDVIGVEAFLSVNQSNIISDYGSGTGAWLALSRRGLQASGGNIRMTGGELLMTDVTTGRLVNVRALNSVTHVTSFGGVRLVNVTVENASSLCTLSNELAATSPVAGLGGFTAIGCDGFVGSDTDVLVYGNSDFTGRVVIRDCDFYYSAGTRTNNNMQFDNSAAEINVDKMSFGKGFKDYLGGVLGGTAHFDDVQIIEITGLTGVTFPAATQVTLPFATASTGQSLARWQSYYAAGTGIFTVPPGGLNNIEIDANVVVSGVTAGGMRLYINSTLWVEAPFVNGSGQLSARIHNLPAGTTIQLALNVSSGSGTADTTTSKQRFSIVASR